MVGMGDDVGRIVSAYLARNADRAYASIGDDISRAIGKADWALAQRLERAKLRLARLRAVHGAMVL